MNRFADTGASDRFDPGLFSPAEIFHENSKLRRTPDGHVFHLSHPTPHASELQHALLHAEKVYRSAAKIKLPQSLPAVSASFEAVLRARSSVREYTGSPLSIAELSGVLALSYGATGKALLEDGTTLRLRRAAPSAGALYPIELYLLVLRVEALTPGLYHYHPQEHSLECLKQANLQQDIERAVLYPEVVEQAGVVILMGAVFHRHRFKYGERGYRFTLLDAGHVGQNIYLAATALGLGAVAIGGYLDDEINQLVEMDGVDEAVVYVIAVGQTGHETQGRQERTTNG